MKKISKIIYSVVVIAMIMSIFSTAFAAVQPKDVTISTSGTNEITHIGGQVIGFIQTVGSIVAVAILVVLGIKYMMGSAEEKAEYKKTMLPYVIGAILIFAASNVAQMIYTFSNNIKTS